MGALSTNSRAALCSARPRRPAITPSSVLPAWLPGTGDCGGRAQGPLVSKVRWRLHLAPRKGLRSLTPSLLQKKSPAGAGAWAWACSGPAWPPSGTRVSWAGEHVAQPCLSGRVPAERKWLRPDIALFVFPVKKTERFAHFLGIRQIFLIPLVSCRLQVFPLVSPPEGQSHDIIRVVPEIAKQCPCSDL